MCGHKIYFELGVNVSLLVMKDAYNNWKEKKYRLITDCSLVQSCKGIIDCKVYALGMHSELCKW